MFSRISLNSHRRIHRRKIAFAIVLVGAGLGLLIVSRASFEDARNVLDRFSGDGSAEPYTESLHRKIQWLTFAMGGLFGMSAIILAKIPDERYLLLWKSIDVKKRNKNTLRWLKVAAHQNVGWLLFLTLFAFFLRWPFLSDPIRFDEAHTYLTYAKLPWFAGVSLYHDPNNHVFNTLLIHFSTTLFGNAEWVIRLPALVAGVCLAPLVFLSARVTAGREAGIAAGTVVAASSALIEYSVLGRGYTLICCLMLINIVLAVRILRRQTGWEWGLMAISSALGLWTIPIMVYPNVLVWGWLLCNGMSGSRRKLNRNRFLKIWGVSVGVTCLLAVGLYFPIAVTSGVHTLTGQGFVEEYSLREFSLLLLGGFSNGLGLWLRDSPLLTTVLLFGLTVIGSCAANSMRTSILQLCNFFLPGIACVLLLMFQRVVPPARVGLFLIPLIAILAGRGFEVVLTGREFRRRNLMWTIWFSAMVILPVMHQNEFNSVRNSRETGRCSDAEKVVEFLQEQIESQLIAEEAPIVAVSPASAPIVYYSIRRELDLKHFLPPNQENIQEAIIVVSHEGRQSVGETLSQLGLEEKFGAQEFVEFQEFQTVSLYRFSTVN